MAVILAMSLAPLAQGQVQRSAARQAQAQPPIGRMADTRRITSFAMPDVVGLSIEQAQQRVQAAGQQVGARSAVANIVARRSDARPAGVIIAQREPPGQAMWPYLDDVGGVYGQVSFNVEVSTGPPAPTTFPMPDVVGLSVAEAEQRVVQAGREVRTRSARASVEYRDDNRPAGQIIGQSPSPGVAMRPYLDDVGGVYGQVSFQVVVSNGVQPAPDFLGMTVETAMQEARRREWVLDVAEARSSPVTRPGLILQQEPRPGQPMSGRRVTVWPSAGFPLPDYVKRPFAEARQDAERLGFELEASAQDHLDVPEGTVIDQQPPAGTLLPLRGPVTLRVSRGWPVPDFVAQTATQATRMAEDIRARLSRSEQDSLEAPAGVVIAQQPAAGNPLPADRVIAVTVSRGYPLPDLVGQSEEAARAQANRLQFRLAVSRTPLPGRPINQVDRQDPAAGTRLPLEAPVQVVVSDGWPTPDFLTLTEAAAQSLAGERQVTAIVTGQQQNRDAVAGTVVAQDPVPGALLPPGQRVSLVLSSGYPTPRFIGLPESDARALAGRESLELQSRIEASDEFPPGTVSAQSPQPGEPLPADSRVAVTLSSGWPTPAFTGQDAEAAARIAADNRITLVEGAAREDYDWASGIVVDQQPGPGETLSPDRIVSVSYSLGWPVAPDAIGQSADAVSQAFRDQHPHTRIELERRFLTLKPVGSVIAQQPDPDVKLGPDQRLVLVASGQKPAWTWAVLGLFALAGTATAYAKFRPGAPPSGTGTANWTRGDGGVSLRVARDHGVQTVGGADGESADELASDEAVRIRVIADLGAQSAQPLDDTGDET